MAILFAASAIATAGHATGRTTEGETMSASCTSASIPPHITRYLRGPTAEDRQFAFLVGDWRVQAMRFKHDGAILAQYEATWSARYLNQGRMLMDDFKALAPDGQPTSSFVTLRTYSVESRRWEMAGLAAMQPAARMEWHGTWAHGEMQIFAVGADPSGREVQTKIRFYDITPERFLWTSESSSDAGATWNRTASLVAVRVTVESSP